MSKPSNIATHIVYHHIVIFKRVIACFPNTVQPDLKAICKENPRNFMGHLI